MMTEYVVMGALLVIMGGAQMWLRWGSLAKEQQEADEALAKRRAEASARAGGGEDDGADEDGDEGSGATSQKQAVLTPAGSRLWNKWTAILGPLGILLGLFLLLWGIFAG